VPNKTSLTPDAIQSLLTHTETLMNHMFWFKHELGLKPTKEHYGSAINFTDIKCREYDFLRELINTIASWVYSKASIRAMVDERLKQTDSDAANAYNFLVTQAFSKFRVGHPQGQFGELLLFNFIQHFFKAVPLLRKMKITTSTGHERFGADAIHVKQDKNNTLFYLGEAKCYESKYQFREAFTNSLSSIMATFNAFDKELNLYIYDDFIAPELADVAKRYKNGELRDVHFELICLVVYHETKEINGYNEEEIKDFIQNTIVKRCRSLGEEVFNIQSNVLNRINYIIFPVWQLNMLLDKFGKMIGV